MSALGDAFGFEHGASAEVGHAEERRGGRPWIPADKRGPKFSGLEPGGKGWTRQKRPLIPLPPQRHRASQARRHCTPAWLLWSPFETPGRRRYAPAAESRRAMKDSAGRRPQVERRRPLGRRYTPAVVNLRRKRAAEYFSRFSAARNSCLARARLARRQRWRRVRLARCANVSPGAPAATANRAQFISAAVTLFHGLCLGVGTKAPRTPPVRGSTRRWPTQPLVPGLAPHQLPKDSAWGLRASWRHP